MAWFKKKADPIAERARALDAEIAALESRIRRYETQLETGHPALPRPAPRPPVAPVFEPVDTDRILATPAPDKNAGHFNEFGDRKYDLPALLRRGRDLLRGPTSSNPKLVSYLAAGGIQGMEPLRRERRIARNRFLALVVLLFLALLGLLAVFLRGH